MVRIVSNTTNGYHLSLDIIERANSVNPARNTSIVDWTLTLHSTNSYFDPLNVFGGLWIGGNHVWAHDGNMSTAMNTAKVLHQTGIEIWHDPDGRKTIEVAAQFLSRAQGQSWHVPSLDLWGTLTLSQVPRGPKVKSKDTHKNTMVYVKHNGAWKLGVPYVKHKGKWKLAGG